MVLLLMTSFHFLPFRAYRLGHRVVICARGFLVGVLVWRRGASSSSCGGCCFTFVILFLLQSDKGWFKMAVMDHFDAVLSNQVEEGFHFFLAVGLVAFP